MRLIRDDPVFWDEQRERPALYVHGLVASRTAPPGTGAALLRWAEGEAARAVCEVTRLDCLESNDALCRYYEQQGYICVGRKAFPHTSVALFEKPVGKDIGHWQQALWAVSSTLSVAAFLGLGLAGQLVQTLCPAPGR